MKYLFLSILAITLMTDPMKIGKINTAKTEAKKAYLAGDYKTAINKYQYLIDSLGVTEDEVKLNLANAFYLEKDTANATSTFQSISNSPNREVSSKAHQQLGIIANQQGKFEQALNDFKQAIKADPKNEEARFNYEMLKKKLEEKKKQEEQKQDQQNKDQKDQKQDQQKKDQDKKDQEKKEQEKKDQEKKDEEKKDQQQKDEEKKKEEQEKKDQQNKEKGKEDQKKEEEKEQQEKSEQEKQDQQAKKPDQLDKEKLQGVMSEEKARMILEAMKNQEKQYLQQQRRKPTKAKDKNKPDW
jgi:Ca-activated chloride channel homolog